MEILSAYREEGVLKVVIEIRDEEIFRKIKEGEIDAISMGLTAERRRPCWPWWVSLPVWFFWMARRIGKWIGIYKGPIANEDE